MPLAYVLVETYAYEQNAHNIGKLRELLSFVPVSPKLMTEINDYCQILSISMQKWLRIYIKLKNLMKVTRNGDCKHKSTQNF